MKDVEKRIDSSNHSVQKGNVNESNKYYAPKPKITPLKKPQVATIKKTSSKRNTKGIPVSQSKKPEKQPDFYKSHTKTIFAKPGQGISKQQMTQRFNQSNIENKEQQLLQIQQYPKGTQFKESQPGEYQVILPEDVALQRTRKELRNIEKLPPGIREVGRTGYFLQQGMFSLSRPFISWLGLEKQHDFYTNVVSSVSTAPFDQQKQIENILLGESKGQYGVHHVSAMDYAFEPVGWSPKGSTDILKQYPIESTIGGISAEFAQGVGFSKAASLLKTGIGKGTKLAAKKTFQFADNLPVKVYMKAPRFTHTAVQLGGYIERKTKIPTNLYKYTQGYRAGQRLLQVKLPTITNKGFTQIRKKFISDKNIPFLQRKQWLSPSEFKRYQNKLFESGKQTISNIKRVTSGIGEQGTITEKHILKRSKIPFKSTHYEKYIFKRNIKNIGKKVQFFDDAIETGKGGLFADDISKKGVGVAKDYALRESKKTPLQDMIEKGYTRTTPILTETKKLGFSDEWSGAVKIEGFQGWGSGYRRTFRIKSGMWDDPVKSFMRTDEATASLIRRKLPTIKNINSHLGRKNLLRTDVESMVIPISSRKLGIMPFVISRVTSKYRTEQQQQSELDFDSLLKQLSSSKYDQLYDVDTGMKSVTAQDSKYKQLLKQDTVLLKKLVYDDMLSYPYIKHQLYGMTIPMKQKMLPFYYQTDFYNASYKKQFPNKGYGKGYRERSWKVPELKDLIGGY